MSTHLLAQAGLVFLCLTGCTGFDGDQVAPSWWSLQATVLVEETLPVPEDTTLTASLISDEADPTSPICTATFVPSSMEDQDPPDATIFHWWQVTLGEATGDCSAPQLGWFADSIEIGVGELHPDIAALLEPAGYEHLEGYLYGAYMRQSDDDDSVWTWGIAGSNASFDSDQESVGEAPLPNGTYQLVPFYLLPLQSG